MIILQMSDYAVVQFPKENNTVAVVPESWIEWKGKVISN